jgi:putative transposase
MTPGPLQRREHEGPAAGCLQGPQRVRIHLGANITQHEPLDLFERVGRQLALVYRALHETERRRVGRDPNASAAIMDAQSVKNLEESGRIRGYDAHKCVKGRKRHLLMDTPGLPLSFSVTPANMHDTYGARCLLAGLTYFVPRLKLIWADQAYQGHDLADWCTSTGDWKLEVVKHPPGVRGWSQQPKR